MDSILPWSILTLFVAYLIWRLISYDPKAPLALPIVGHLHLLGKSPQRSLAKLAQKYGPLMMLKFGAHKTLVISSPEWAKEALKTHDIVFSSRPSFAAARVFSHNCNGLIWAPYGEAWRNLRKLCNLELLSPKRVAFFTPARASEIDLTMSKLLECSRNKQVVNLADIVSDLAFNTMTRMVMSKSYSGGKDEEAWTYKVFIRKAAMALGDVYLGDYLPWLAWLESKKVAKMNYLLKHMDQYLQKQIDEHRSNPEKFNDFITIMLANKEVSSSDNAMKTVVWDLLAGGTDTSAAITEWAMSELLKKPEVLKKVKEELDSVVGRDAMVREEHLEKLKFLAAVTKETLRMHPPAPLLVYAMSEECKFGKYILPKGRRAIVNAYAIARDENVWKDALNFDPERFIQGDIDVLGRHFEVLPFGTGRRGCPGTQLGMIMVQLALASLLHGFDWEMPEGMRFEEIDMSEGFGFTLPKKVHLKVIPVARLNPQAYMSVL